MRLYLETRRLRLRLAREGDAAAITEQIGEWEVASRLARVPFPYDLSMAHEWLARQLAERRAGTGVFLCITLAGENDTLRGGVGLHDRNQDSAELGYWLARPYWGRGLMTEAAGAAIAFGFEVLGLQRLTSGHLIGNEASGAVLRKLGFKVIGNRTHKVASQGGKEMTGVGMALDAADWRAGSAATDL